MKFQDNYWFAFQGSVGLSRDNDPIPCQKLGYAIESYTFRQTTFEEGSECAELFITFQTAKPYDIFTKAPALMKFDKNCNTTGLTD